MKPYVCLHLGHHRPGQGTARPIAPQTPSCLVPGTAPPPPAKLTALRWPSPQVSFTYIKGIARNASLRLDPPLGILTVTHDVHGSPIFPTVCRNKPLIHPFLLPTNTWAVSGLGRRRQGCSGHLRTSLCGRLFSFLLGKGFGSALLGWRVAHVWFYKTPPNRLPKRLSLFAHPPASE